MVCYCPSLKKVVHLWYKTSATGAQQSSDIQINWVLLECSSLLFNLLFSSKTKSRKYERNLNRSKRGVFETSYPGHRQAVKMAFAMRLSPPNTMTKKTQSERIHVVKYWEKYRRNAKISLPLKATQCCQTLLSSHKTIHSRLLIKSVKQNIICSQTKLRKLSGRSIAQRSNSP